MINDTVQAAEWLIPNGPNPPKLTKKQALVYDVIQDYPEAACLIVGCRKENIVAKGLCSSHYHRLQRYGDPLGGGAFIGSPLEDLIRELYTETDDCILWTHAKSSSGYGYVKIDGVRYFVHRIALEYHKGSPPSDAPNALHRPVVCHNSMCFNYRHLRWGSQKQNILDRKKDGTSIGAPGELNGRAKITDEQVNSIRKDNRTIGEIAIELDLHYSTVQRIRSLKSWRLS